MNDDPTTERPWHWGRAAWKIAVGLAATWAVFHFDVPAHLEAWCETSAGGDNFVGRQCKVLIHLVPIPPLVLLFLGMLELFFRRPLHEVDSAVGALPGWQFGLLVLALTVGAISLVLWSVGVI